ncbi:MAG: phenylalanine--tRNA ligase subunit beta [Microthrixaceae bacterium]
MKVLLNWLREFAPIEGEPEDIAVQLTDLGMELDSVHQIGIGLDGIIVARVLDIREHPDADKIRLVDVDTGDGQALQICCGASNMSVGDLVPLATIGTTMPGGMAIAKRKMRGQASNGMLCSAREMEVGDDHAGILILDSELGLGTPIAEALELTRDVVFDFDTLPNRPDTLGMFGVARDLAAHQKVALTQPEPRPTTTGPDASDLASVRNYAPDLCGTLTGLVLSNVKIGPSPRWMAQRLIGAGMRPINNAVDVSNYVMLELGQPTHTYDLAKLSGATLGIRWARDGEKIQTLDGVDRVLQKSDGVLVDADDSPVGVAGVMGGASTEISESTTQVLIESAWWNPDVVAATAARLNLHSEASLRFKRGTDPTMASLAALRVAELLVEVAGATLHSGVLQVDGQLPEPTTVRVRPAKINSILGLDLERGQIAELLDPIGFTSSPAGDDLDVVVPPWRPDSAIEEDVAEEVARHFGMARIPKTVPVSPHTGELTQRQRDRRVLRRVLTGAGLSEAMPMPFLAPGDLESFGFPADGLSISNPLVAEESILRTTLLPGLVKAVAFNASHRQVDVGLFEIGRTFDVGEGVVVDVQQSSVRDTVLAGESERLAVVLAGREAPDAVSLAERLLRSIHRWPSRQTAEPILSGAEIAATRLVPVALPGLHPGRSAQLVQSDVVVGQVGEIDPGILEKHGIDERVAWIELDLTTLLSADPQVPSATPVSRFPSSDIDLAFVVAEDVAVADVRATIVGTALDASPERSAPVGVDLFDVFRSESLGADQKSLAFRIRFQAMDRTLTDSEVAGARQAVIAAVEKQHAATLRG